MKDLFKLLVNKPMMIILILGFASGLPLGLTMGTLQAWYTVEGVDIVTIGFLGLIGQPYVYKFLWAPVMDRVTPKGGRRRGWILICQAALIVTLLFMSTLNPADSPVLLLFVALLLAFFSSSQDIAIDAYRTEILSPDERGTGAAMAVTGYRVAMLISGGLALVMADRIGFQLTYALMGICFVLTAIATYIADEPVVYGQPPSNFFAACVEPFKEFLSRKNAVALLALIVLYKLGDAFAGNLTTAFLLRGVGFSLTDVGLINKTVGLVSTLLGVFAGGVMMARVGLFKALLWFGILQALSNLAFLALAVSGPNYTLMVSSVFIENFCGGLGTAAFIAFLMSLCNPRYTATQFALLSALSAVGRVFVGPMAGYLVNKVGWVEFFLWTLLLSLPGILLLFWVRGTVKEHDQAGKTQPGFVS